VNNNFIHVTDQTVLINIRPLSVPRNEWNQKADIAFQPSTYFSPDFYINLTTDLISKQRIDTILSQSTKGSQLSSTQIGILSRLIDLILKPIVAILLNVIKWIFIICFLIAIFKLIWL